MKFPDIIKGAIFDVDDTLLDNQADRAFGALHEHSRFGALQHVVEKYNLPSLQSLTYEENLVAFLTAKEHSLPGAVWNVLHQKGIVATEDLDPDHQLLKEIVYLKELFMLIPYASVDALF
jgi:FMN phosphatase YigB (HAD superfamily)